MTIENQTEAATTAAEGDFESAFAEFSKAKDEPLSAAVEAREEPAIESQAAEQAEPVPTADELRAQLEAERRRAQEYEHKFKSEVGRQTALQRQIQELQQQQRQSSQAPVQRASPSMQKLKEDFPEIASALETEIEHRLDSVKQEVDQRFQPIVQAEKQREFAAEEAATLSVYPNLKQIVNTREFADWLPNQPAVVQALAGSPRAADAVALLDYFTGGRRQDSSASHVQSIKEKREQQLNRHVSVRNSAPPPIADAPDDFESAFKHFAQKRDRSALRR